MEERNKILEILERDLFNLEYVHALWLEGSIAESDDDRYSDIDLWISVDDDRLRSIFETIEKSLEIIAPIDFKLELKPEGELAHNIYHLSGTNEFLTLDINTQKVSRDVVLTDGIDIYKTIFDKNSIIKTTQRVPIEFDKAFELEKLLKFIDNASLSVKKNVLRGKIVESREYYRNILVHTLAYLRNRAALNEKVGFDFKHMYKDLPAIEAKKIEELYSLDASEQTIEALKSWLKEL